jgi:FkbM family methyltransferase
MICDAAAGQCREDMIWSSLYDLNHAPIWRRELKVWDQRVRAASLDRLLFLVLHRIGLMGRDEARLLKKLIEPGMRVVDVGANIGLYTLLLARLVEDDGCVFAFEPEPNLFSVLCENCAANGAVNITPFQCAAGDVNRRATFQRNIFNSGDNRLGVRRPGAQTIEVEVARLDDLLPVRTLEFIKLDVQGHELVALCGMERVLASSPNVRVLFEFCPADLRTANTHPEGLLQFFRDRGFELYEMKDARLRTIPDAERLISDLRGEQYTNLLASRNVPPGTS